MSCRWLPALPLALSALLSIACLLQAAPAPNRDGAKEIVNSLGMKLMRIPAGKFAMGPPKNEVRIAKVFYMGAYEVTQAQYVKVAGKNPSHYSVSGGGRVGVQGMDTSSFPVENVSWDEAVAFCAQMSALPKEKATGRTYRLPTEAEWEYACRAGTKTAFHYGESLSAEQANCNGNFPAGGAGKGPDLGRTCKVGSYRPNAWGLFDMHGNVLEWCSDDSASPNTGVLPGPIFGGTAGKVIRGGSFYDRAEHCRAGMRNAYRATSRDRALGFRVVMVLGK